MAMLTIERAKADHAIADLLVENLRVALAILREGTPRESRCPIVGQMTRSTRERGLKRLEGAMRNLR